MSGPPVVTAVTGVDNVFKKIASGKVREIYEVDANTLLFVATDRISAYDVILANGIPGKGAMLTQLSAYWFSFLHDRLPALRTHWMPSGLPPQTPADVRPLLLRRSMQVRRSNVLPLESIVRGYITGSAWTEYKSHGTVHGMPMPSGLQESQRLERAIWTPSTKAEAGEHDENISRERAAEIVGPDVAKRVEDASLTIYELARNHAEQRGIIIADTKFEFGLDKDTGEIILIDEVLTPDSSRFWPAESYEVGRAQASFDKQYLRDWLTKEGLKGVEGARMPEDVVQTTATKYREAYEKLTGQRWTE